MKEDDFRFYQGYLKEKTGLHLTPEKTYLLNARLAPLCKTLGFETLEDYTSHLRATFDPAGLGMVIEAMMTNETSFFRDAKPFQYLKQSILPAFFERRSEQRKIRIYSAACSTGQEAYSIAITIREMADKNKDGAAGWTFDILGTDIADNVLKKAQTGEYNNFEIQRGLSMPVIVKNFRQQGDNWTIRDEIRNMVRFRKSNLLENPAGLGMFDIVFCRNVLIYFSAETKLRVLKSLHAALPEDGVLLLGSCENVMSEQSGFVPVEDMHGVYIKRRSAGAFTIPLPDQPAKTASGARLQ